MHIGVKLGEMYIVPAVIVVLVAVVLVVVMVAMRGVQLDDFHTRGIKLDALYIEASSVMLCSLGPMHRIYMKPKKTSQKRNPDSMRRTNLINLV